MTSITKVQEVDVSIFSEPYFIATKIVALNTRTNGKAGRIFDWRWSRDFEDIVKIIREVDLLVHFRKDEAFLEESVSAHLVPPFYTDDDIEIIIEKINQIADRF